MEQVYRAHRQPFEWRESKMVAHQDELHADHQILATLRWKGVGNGVASTLAFAVSPEGQWIFEQPGIFSRDVQVRNAGSDAPVALFRPHWIGAGGRLDFADNRAFYWTAMNFGQTRWAFTSASGKQLVRFENDVQRVPAGALVMVEPSILESLALPACECALLMLLGRYLMVLKKRDAATP